MGIPGHLTRGLTMIRKAMVLTVAAAVVAASAAVMADVILNPDGTGFVGKGDVQSAFGWNNAQLQLNGENVEFSAIVSQTITQDCYTTGQNKTFVGVRTGAKELATSVEYTARRHMQIDGYILEGFAEGGEWSDVEWQGSGSGNPGASGCPGGASESHPQGPPEEGPIEFRSLSVSFGGTTVQIWP
jgi:hypothetical protein